MIPGGIATPQRGRAVLRIVQAILERPLTLTACAREEPQWLAPAYRWALVLDGLRGHDRDHPDTGPHPRTTEWQAAHGRAIPGGTCAEQLEAVQRWDTAARRDQQQARVIRLGAHTPFSIEQAIGVRVTDPDWDARLTEALTDFPGSSWPLDELRPPAGEAPA